ncbi:MAG TPA: hypothetical protein VFV99_16805 [Kofleriaceae bacterium]|nr:hypothetical protein [Kofleriaceae bacterium]
MRAVMLVALVAGCGGDDTPPLGSIDAAAAADASGVDAAPPRELIMETQPLQPGELVEGIMTGGPNDLALIHLEAPVTELDWNIHGHPDNTTVVVYEELNKMTVDYAYTPAAQGDWFLLIRNSGPTNMDVKVRVGLYGGMTWQWQ